MRLPEKVELYSTRMAAKGYDAKTDYTSLGEFGAEIVAVSAGRYNDDAIQFQERDAVTHRITLRKCAGASSCVTIRHCDRWFRVVNQTERKKGRIWLDVLNVALVRQNATIADMEKPVFADVQD